MNLKRSWFTKVLDYLLAGLMIIGASVGGFCLLILTFLLSCAPYIVAGVVIVWIMRALGWF
jgi:hypothetical protein